MHKIPLSTYSTSHSSCSGPSEMTVDSTLNKNGAFRTVTQMHSNKWTLYAQELVTTERNFVADLTMVRNVFLRPLVKCDALKGEEVDQLFVNWTELLMGAKELCKRLEISHNTVIGQVLLSRIDSFESFVYFCQHQQAAIDFLASKESSSSLFRNIYQRCCQHQMSRGLPLSYFLLIPMNRVTKYPLLLDKLLLYGRQEPHCDYDSLESAHRQLKALVYRVNQMVTEVESLQMLYWAQQHIRCETIRPKLVFASHTHNGQRRSYIHSGPLYKTKSNRLLIGLLFNDMLMLTTPDESIAPVDSFKLTKNSDLMLSMYKTPILLQTASLQLSSQNTGSNDESNRIFAMTTGDDTISLRAITNNARIMWTNQVEKAVRNCQTQPPISPCPVAQSGSHPATVVLGRLLVELVSIRHLAIPVEFGTSPSVYCRMHCSGSAMLTTSSLDLTSKSALCTTQFPVESELAHFYLSIHLRRSYAPDLLAGRIQVPIGQLVNSSGSHRGPILRQLTLQDSQVPSDDDDESFVMVKFVIQLFE